MKKSIIKVESYRVAVKRRSFLACQENNTSPSVYEKIHEIKYRIVADGEVLADGFSSEYIANLMYHLNWTPEGIQTRRNTLLHDYKRALKTLRIEFKRADKQNEAQYKLMLKYIK